ncbi:MAG TPA: glycosyltransferase family 2 protein [Phycisphaerae bacterium]|jgi:glycosyltransferase involved in cell wall biosynthesis|nr:glycosyltransferase family 2 protein [Phycisphaerae bacterium]HOB72997.1 glycosyltransferase family 2 protein [Phycisphaerae bacterium]HOJ52954.1 glycosyltransferase family 2 protein [Phycisphaerae bacterium]HOL24691.1 glycosyltransferase family 2 protein [Phycisphaerae bacterium]HPP19227.1 glycosyltransferase family 2 protein [Phycisphaerae bacterium]
MSLSSADISVIIPCLNAERTLGAALESVFNQTVPPREVLVIDDASTDGSVRVARSFGPRVRVLPNPAHGTGPARRLGVQEAKGKYIAYVDADDLLEPLKHERQLKVLERSDIHTYVHTGAWVFFDDPARPAVLRDSAAHASGRCTAVVFEHNPICGPSIMVARQVILEVGNYDPDLWGTDDYYMSLACSTCCDFVYLPEPLYRLRRHTGNMSNRRARMMYHHWLAQERWRQRFPEAYAALPAEVLARCTAGILYATRRAYWERESNGYRQLLKLARQLAPDDPQIRAQWRRRWVPMSALRLWDRTTQFLNRPPEVAAQ